MFLTNSPIVMPAENVTWNVEKISVNAAFGILDEEGFTSAIGHQGTVDVLKKILPGIAESINLNRITIDTPSEHVVFKLKGRLPEGKIIDAAEIEQIGYEFWLVTPIKVKVEKPVPEMKEDFPLAFEEDDPECPKCGSSNWKTIRRPRQCNAYRCVECGYVVNAVHVTPSRSREERALDREIEHSRI